MLAVCIFTYGSYIFSVRDGLCGARCRGYVGGDVYNELWCESVNVNVNGRPDPYPEMPPTR